MSRPNIDIKYQQLFINNEWVDAESGKTFSTIDPCNEEVICNVAEGDKADIDRAVRAARDAFKLNSPWRTMNASDRGQLLHKFANLIDRDQKYIAELNTWDNGKTFEQSFGMTYVGAKMIRYFAGAADKMEGKTIPIDGDFFCYTRLEPRGIIGSILPWNFPVMLLMLKIAPALASGNVIIIKPAEQTPLATLYIAQLTKEAGFPPGVVNVIPGYGHTAGAAISEHMDIDMVSFTGSTEVGKLVHQAAGRSNLKHVTLELGGKSPHVVFDDCKDLKAAVETCHFGLFSNQGQSCISGSRVFVQDTIYDEFVKLSVERALKKCVGSPWEKETEQGPQIDRAQFDKIMELIESGKKEGASMKCGGKKTGDKGYFIQPTVFADVTDDMRIAREEIFGPVMQILKFNSMEELIERANNTSYGLAAGIHTTDIEKAIQFSHSVQAGLVWVNTYNVVAYQAPFGGYKMSGIGRELGKDGLSDYYEIKTVMMKTPQKNS